MWGEPQRVRWDAFGVEDADLQVEPSDLEGLDSAPSLGSRTASIAASMRDLGKAASEETLAKLEAVSAQAASDVRSVLRTAPAELVRLVRGAVLSAAEALEEDPNLSAQERASLDPLQRAAVNVSHDPRNMREGAEALEKLASVAQMSPSVARLASQTVELLERKGVLGQSTLALLSGFLVAAGSTAISWAHGQSMVLQAGPARFSVNRLGEYSASLTVHNPAWPAMATRVVVTRDVRGGSKGAVLEPLSDLNLEAPAVTSVTIQPAVIKTTVGKRRSFPVEVGTQVTLTPGDRPEVEAGGSLKVRF